MAFVAVVANPKRSLFTVCSLVIEPLVDGGCVRCAVDSNGIVDVVGDILGEIADDDIFRVRKHVRKRADESELDECGGDTDGANEKAHEGWWVGRECDKPRDVVLRLGLKPENSGKECRSASAETVLDLGTEGENILVGKSESGKRRGAWT